ncbi:hypothetical protein [Pseudanabaena sp. UWO310]|uniref:hypothetical protein n=1 Tax=Pseudanabaena sp. UWO310 TaxID=2480795 RepID=UPI001157E266|nr:hypothetical protein [Pseudanabaena sp. UWO310]TYQ29279.1 hypothetical protein PseudUWO310_12870 [Pseudanabaena sp. UWO310]
MVAISEIVKNGIVFDMKNWGNDRSGISGLSENIDRLFTLLQEREINYLLVGGVALLSYIDGRNTQDIDLILSQKDLIALPELTVADQNQNFVRATFDNLQVDLLLTQNTLFKYIAKKCTTSRQFGDLNVRCVTVEGLLILKLYALPSLYRQNKFDRASIYENDILLLLLKYPTELKPIWKLLQKHLLPSDINEIQEITTDIQKRIQRFRSR